MQKVALTGSIRWDDKVKVKNILFSLKTKFKNELHIIGGGMNCGVDVMIKKTCLEFAIKFSEVAPYNLPWTAYCIDPPYKYNKAYNKKFIYMRNKKLCNESDTLIIFKPTEESSSIIDDLIIKFSKKNKKILVIN